MLDKEKTKLLKRLKEDPVFFIEKSCKIIDKKTNQLIRFKLNKIQRYFLSVCGKFSFIIKSRKGGMSTLSIALFIHRCTFRENERAILLCQNEDATKKMFRERVRPMIDNCDFKINCRIRESEGLIEFKDTGSTFYIGTAGSKTFGRGSDITMFHLSEYAHWENPDVLTGIEEALMDNATGIIETTANGINFAYKDWKRAVNGLSRYKPVFVPWFFDETYKLITRIPVPHLDDKEKELIDAFSLDNQQLAWRREKMKNMSMPEFFPQEYPATAEEAFVSMKSMVFDWITLMQYEKICEDPIWRGRLREVMDEIKFIPEAGGKGDLSVWKLPANGRKYIMGADVAEGIEDGAYSTAEVFDIGNGEQVAEYHAHISPDDFGYLLDKLGRFYNYALISPESWPGCGGTTTVKLIDLAYPAVYKRQRAKHSQKKEDQLWGWETTKRTKPLMIYALSEALKKFEIGIKSKQLIEEMKSFVVDGEKLVPQEGCFSDRIIGCAIAWHILTRELDYKFADDGSTKFKDKLKRFLTGGNNFITRPKWYGRLYGRRHEAGREGRAERSA